jgi:hypothetical protein
MPGTLFVAVKSLLNVINLYVFGVCYVLQKDPMTQQEIEDLVLALNKIGVRCDWACTPLPQTHTQLLQLRQPHLPST